MTPGHGCAATTVGPPQPGEAARSGAIVQESQDLCQLLSSRHEPVGAGPGPRRSAFAPAP